MAKELKDIRALAERAVSQLESFNGSAEMLRGMSEIVTALDPKKLAYLVRLAEGRAEDEAFWRGIRKRFNPLKPFGVVLWTMLLTLISGAGVGLVRLLVEHWPH